MTLFFVIDSYHNKSLIKAKLLYKWLKNYHLNDRVIVLTFYANTQ